MGRFTTLEIQKEEFSFSAGHFTIFSATERERLHGHNYYVSVAFTFELKHNGLSFDYRYYKKKIQQICDNLHLNCLLPEFSPYMPITEEGDYWVAIHNKQKMLFLKSDVIILPLANITIEELAHWFLQQVLSDENDLTRFCIHGISVKVFNGPGQGAECVWGKT